VSSTFGSCTALIFLLVVSAAFAQYGPSATSATPALTISVYDYAHISAPFLAAAEEDERRIFRKAGLETVWVSCFPKPETMESPSCRVVDRNHLVIKILSHALSAQDHDRNGAFGYALVDDNGSGYYTYAFYDRIERVAEERKLGQALLAAVMAHEIGHLLLGSNSHSVSGIMTAHWDGTELRRISEGNMCFLSGQSRVIRDRMHTRELIP